MMEDSALRRELEAAHEQRLAGREEAAMSLEHARLRATVVHLESAVHAALAEAERARALAHQVTFCVADTE